MEILIERVNEVVILLASLISLELFNFYLALIIQLFFWNQ